MEVKSSKLKILRLLIWICFILTLFVSIEIFARYKQNYLLWGFELVGQKFYELDQMKIWNKKAYLQNPDYFRERLMPLEFFEADSPHPFYLYKPNQKMTYKDGHLIPAQGGDRVFYSINSLGLKNPEVLGEKTKREIRIVALGASTTEGWSSNDNAYPEQLEQILKSQGYNVEVINAGHGGYKIDDILAFYQNEIVPLGPDMIIFYEGSLNDITPQVQEWLKEPWGGPHSWPEKYPEWFQFFHNHSAVFVSFTRIVGIDKKDTTFVHSFDKDLPKPAMEHYREKVKEIVRVSKENNIRPVLATFITVAHEGLQINPKEKPFIWNSLELKLFPLSTGEVETIHSAYNNVLEEIAGEESVEVVDTASLFPKDTKYFMDYIHLTPEGDKLLAQHIANFLVKEVLPNYTNTDD